MTHYKSQIPKLNHSKSGMRDFSSGQSLLEVLIGISIGVLFIGGAVGIIVLSLRVGFQNKFSQTATELNQELMERVATFSDANWHNLYDIMPHGSSNNYYLTISGSFFSAASGTETLTVNNQEYTRSFTSEDVYRDDDGMIVTSSGTQDPSTLKITATTSWVEPGGVGSVQVVRYIARTKTRIFRQTDWSGGSNQEGPITAVNNRFATSSNIEYSAVTSSLTISDLSASSTATSTTNIDATAKYAWNDVIGWIDFNITNTVVVSSTMIQGYASSSVGRLALDCATSPTPDCSFPYQVSNDGSGALSGYGWNDAIGWVSFSGSAGTSTYGVIVDSETGDFSGWAWNDTIGWISFNCTNTATCGTSDYHVKTLWGSTVTTSHLISSIFDTQVAGGAGFNTILWQGVQPTGTAVKFQLATSNSDSGPWNYNGPDGSSATYYQSAGPNVQIKIKRLNHDNNQYIRYKVFLDSNVEKTLSPQVDDIIIGWSP